jgi:hypothetical protein
MSIEAIILTCMSFMGLAGLYLLNDIRSSISKLWTANEKLWAAHNNHVQDWRLHKTPGA